MFEGGFRQVLRREVDAIPLPPEDKWVPAVASAWFGAGLLVIGAAAFAVLLGVAVLSIARSRESPAAQEPARVTPPARPTVINSIGNAPLPNLYRNTRFNYNLVLPAWFHETPVSLGTATAIPGLLERKLFTARSEADETRFAGGQFLPWDLIVEVYQRGDRSVEEWAGTLGCNRSGPAGASTCVLTTTRIHGTEVLVGTRSAPLAGKIYLVNRGDQLLVLRYAMGDESNRPADVTQATLDQIIESLGLP